MSDNLVITDDLDPFKGSWELEHDLVGPEIWRESFAGGEIMVSARYHKGHWAYMIKSVTTINGAKYAANILADTPEKLTEAHRVTFRSAFRRARERVAV